MSTYTQILYQIVFATKNHEMTIIEYVKNQKEHHKTLSFRDEYISLLKEHEIEFDEKYLLYLLNPVGVPDMVFTFLATGFTCGYSHLTTSWFDIANDILLNSDLVSLKL